MQLTKTRKICWDSKHNLRYMEQAVNNVQNTNNLQRVIADAVTEAICNKRSKQSRGRMKTQIIMDAHYNSISYQITQH